MNNISKIYIKTLYNGRQCRMTYRELGINYMKRITLDEIELKYKLNKYEDLYKKVMELYDAGMLKPVKASGKNGKKTALYMDYWIVEEEKDYSEYLDELYYSYVPAISTE